MDSAYTVKTVKAQNTEYESTQQDWPDYTSITIYRIKEHAMLYLVDWFIFQTFRLQNRDYT